LTSKWWCGVLVAIVYVHFQARSTLFIVADRLDQFDPKKLVPD